MTPFTPEQVLFIEQLIEKRLTQRSLDADNPRPVALKNFHTIPEIRALILEHLNEFREIVGDSPFPISLLRFFLSKKVQLRSGDSEVLPNRKSGLSRFDGQLCNALSSPTEWPEAPFRSSSMRGWYEFVPKPQQPLIDF